MALIKSKTPKIRGLHEVGRYAVGVQWVDGHDSILPLENLRRRCPCDACKGNVNGEVPPAEHPHAPAFAAGRSGGVYRMG